ncbi:DUF433 domain-containing protein [Candidatus Uhrbacteria bacterium]|nr:DUF433 domain-containing protein [Candidatus Uhrbacteria bacterium]
MEQKNTITTNINVLGGKPVIKETRVPVTLVIDELAGGLTFEELMREYELTREQINAALRYAAAALQEDIVFVA